MALIKDGTGSGHMAAVNSENRLETESVSISDVAHATDEGRSYNINTGIITLTDAVDTPVLYFKNNEIEDFHISAIAVGVGPTTGGSGGIPKITVIRNPTAGTIVSNATDVDINSNRNFGNSIPLVSDAYKGATGNTMTDGEDHIIFFQTAGGRLYATIDENLPQGSSLGVKIDPQASNTSMDVYVALIGFKQESL